MERSQMGKARSERFNWQPRTAVVYYDSEGNEITKAEWLQLVRKKTISIKK